jgi:hypothetical protein
MKKDEIRDRILETVWELQALGWSEEGILAKALRDFGVERASIIAKVLDEARNARSVNSTYTRSHTDTIEIPCTLRSDLDRILIWGRGEG